MENNTSNSQHHAVKFHGRPGEYFAIWLVNVLLTMVTLGIYSAWATVRRRRYFYGNTEIDGGRFDYHATGWNIFKGRVIVFIGLVLFFILSSVFPPIAGLFALAFLALIPWFVIRSWRYNALMSSFRGVRFNYRCRIGRAYWTMYLCPVLLVLALYIVVGAVAFAGIQGGLGGFSATMFALSFILLLAGLAVVQGIIAALNQDLFVNNMSFGNLAFQANLNKKSFIKMILTSYLIFAPFLAIAVMLSLSLMSSLFFASINGYPADMLTSVLISSISNLLIALLLMFIGALLSSAYLVVAQRNYVFNQTQVGDKLRLNSTFSTLSFVGLMLTNSLIVIFTLGLGAPIAEVRLARYVAANTAVIGDMSLDNVVGQQTQAGSAVAEEVVAAFDLNPGI